MVTGNSERLETRNEQLRQILAEFGVRSDPRKTGETPENENARLREDLRWYLEVLRGVGR